MRNLFTAVADALRPTPTLPTLDSLFRELDGFRAAVLAEAIDLDTLDRELLRIRMDDVAADLDRIAAEQATR